MQHTDWIDKATALDYITLHESATKQTITSTDCPFMTLRRVDNGASPSVMIALKDCDSKAKFLCTLDVSRAHKVSNFDKKSKLSCLPKEKMESLNDKEYNGRRKRDSNYEMSERTEKGKGSKLLIYVSSCFLSHNFGVK